jgi:hypothetical protein
MHHNQVEKRPEEGDNVSTQNEEVNWNAGFDIPENEFELFIYQAGRRVRFA